MMAYMPDQRGRLAAPWLVPVEIPTVGVFGWRKYLAVFKSRKFTLARNWFFVDSENNVCMIPEGFVPETDTLKPYYFETDGTSWPRFVQSFVSKVGLGLTAALAHDFALRYRCFLNPAGEVIRTFDTRKQCDDEYHAIDVRVNEIEPLSDVKWLGVRLGSWPAWQRYRKMPDALTDARRLL